MGKRQVALFALAGAGGLAWWLARRADGGGVYAPLDLSYAGLVGDSGGGDPGAGGDTGGGGVPAGYLPSLSSAEDPGGGLYAKNPYSSASGKYQFLKSTWTALGGDWGPNPSAAFGGLQPSEAEQDAMAAKLTAGNANLLGHYGAAVNSISLYAAHIFGPKTAAVALTSDPATPLASLVGASTVAKNPALGQTVASFMDYLARKVG
jgi:hypothetical protein